ncbi:MAG TPA: hypothetical protein VD713_06160, partial [Sphingomonadales bacterium]|nr:hypothetical protein [Sphingomonadales bacterium]
MFSIFLPVAATAENVPFSDSRWEFAGEKTEVTTHAGREALLIQNGRAMLADADFENGVIEFDVQVTPERGFHGVFWRLHEGGNGENFYIRSHQSGNEDANQYTPLVNRLTAWQLYFGPRFSAPTVYRFGEWLPVKIVVSGDAADIYVDSVEPVLHIADLKHAAVAGPLMLSSAFAPAYFSNFRYEKRDGLEMAGKGAPPPSLEPGTVLEWEVSQPFDEAALANTASLSPAHLEGLTWQPLAAEEKGYANLSWVTPFAEGANTVFARIRISSAEESVRFIRFGYSDRVKVFLNGELLYSGDNGYQSRDYRYLGTIGLFDEVPLHLRAGVNELVFAVSESFGGWGI